ncbi:hypothetical protein MPEAHAMD_7218 [Methylobacterium frigidaeris]|uniref:DNA-binding protein n=1 Tax=Methylobacterium frigidaeris TaxID=2038277 RepID=A0AA37HJK7_9HYPH|nr:hypothetical protein MPEAHAMD_7218 [Methylobacterium frigidaeris]
MKPSWKTVAEVAVALKIDLKSARALVEAANCPKVFGPHGTAYLI